MKTLFYVKPCFPSKLDRNFDLLQFRGIPGFDGYAIDSEKKVWTCRGNSLRFNRIDKKYNCLLYLAQWKRMKSRFLRGTEVIRLIAGKGQRLFPVNYLFDISWNDEI